MPIPEWMPRTVYEPYPADLETQRGPRPDVVPLPDGRLIVDWFGNDKEVTAVIWDNKDHPNMAKLPADAPESVRALYSRPVQLSILRATDCWGALAAADKAMAAWRSKYG